MWGRNVKETKRLRNEQSFFVGNIPSKAAKVGGHQSSHDIRYHHYEADGAQVFVL